MSDMEQNGLIRLTQNLIATADFSVKLSPAMQALKEEILKQYEAGKYESHLWMKSWRTKKTR